VLRKKILYFAKKDGGYLKMVRGLKVLAFRTHKLIDKTLLIKKYH